MDREQFSALTKQLRKYSKQSAQYQPGTFKRLEADRMIKVTMAAMRGES